VVTLKNADGHTSTLEPSIGREARMVTPAMEAALIGPLYSLRKNGAQHGGHEFHLRLSTYWGLYSTPEGSTVATNVMQRRGLTC